MIKKIILGAVAGILTCAAAYSQTGSKHELSVWVAGGLSTLQYSTDFGDSKGKAGGSFGVGYNYYFTNQWSLSTGLELSLYNSKVNTDPLNDFYDANDGEYDFEFRTRVTGYKEKQKAMLLNIPVMAQFELPVGYNKFYAAGGFKFGIPVSSKYKVTNAIIENSGFYPEWSGQQNLILHTQKFMGFGTFSRNDVEDDLDLKLSCMVALEAGMKWNLSSSMDLYTGAYFEYGLNDIKKDANKRLIGYNRVDPENFVNNSILSSEYPIGANLESYADKVVPMAAGIKVRLAFKL